VLLFWGLEEQKLVLIDRWGPPVLREVLPSVEGSEMVAVGAHDLALSHLVVQSLDAIVSVPHLPARDREALCELR
jgi:hypothetical protein